MVRGRIGELKTISRTGGEVAQAFVPAPLPPQPGLNLEGDLQESLDFALVAIGRLDSVSTLLPDTHLFLYTYVRQEAVLSSQIEGTQSTLADLMLFELDEAPGVPVDDVVEVSNYVAALEHGLQRVRDGFPVSNRLIREMHAILLARGRGANMQPGGFRTSQNWIGGTRPGNAAFVPPPPQDVVDCMAHLERFIHDQPMRTPALTKAALVHVQFETIHPFLDGNGRMGRLLITLLLCVGGLLHEPLLYLSGYLRAHRDEYYSLLDVVRQDGDWERWLAFFARAVQETAAAAVATAGRLVATFEADGQRIRGIGRSVTSALRVHQALQRRPLGSIGSLARETGLTVPTITAALAKLTDLKIVREATGRRRNRIFVYGGYLDLLNEGSLVPPPQPV
jgi:Fic family protein